MPSCSSFSPTPCPIHLFVSSFGLRLLMARVLALFGLPPECQFLDNDEVCTSGPPLRSVQRSYATRVARLCASFLSSFVCTSLFRRGVLMRLRMFGYIGDNGTDHERCAYIIEYIWLFPRYREKSRIQCSFGVSTVTE